MANEVESILESQEKIIWQDVINRKVMYFYLIIALMIIGGLASFLFSQKTINYTSNGVANTIAGSTVGGAVLGLGLLITLLAFWSSYVVQYYITNKRVLIKSGLIGTDFNSIYFTEIKTANVNVGLIGKIFSVGTINIDTGKIETVTSGSGNERHTKTQTAYDKLSCVNRPYEVYKYFQTSLTSRQESLYSGRADKENNPGEYKN